MVRLTKGEINTLNLTLTENSTASTPIYLFKLVNQQSMVEYYFIATDTSQYIQRYNRFLVTEKENADTLVGEISLGNEGFYNYFVYETTLANLDGLTTAKDAIPAILKEVENGLVWVIPSPIVYTTYTPSPSTTYVYNQE